MLAKKVKSTWDKALNDPGYTTFLKHFGEFKVAKIEQKEVSSQEYIIEELQNLRKDIARLETRTVRDNKLRFGPDKRYRVLVDGQSWPAEKVPELLATLSDLLPDSTLSFNDNVLQIDTPITLTSGNIQSLNKFIDTFIREGREAALIINSNL